MIKDLLGDRRQETIRNWNWDTHSKRQPFVDLHMKTQESKSSLTLFLNKREQWSVWPTGGSRFRSMVEFRRYQNKDCVEVILSVHLLVLVLRRALPNGSFQEKSNGRQMMLLMLLEAETLGGWGQSENGGWTNTSSLANGHGSASRGQSYCNKQAFKTSHRQTYKMLIPVNK